MRQTVGEQLKLEDEEVSITLRRAWDRALRGLATRVNKPTFEAHIRTLRPVSLAEEAEENGGPPVCIITLGVPSAFTREWVSQRHGPLIQGLLEEMLDREVRVRFVLTAREKTGTAPVAPAAPAPRAPNLFDEEKPKTPATPEAVPAPTRPGPKRSAPPTSLPDTTPLDASGDLFGESGPGSGVPERSPAESRETMEARITPNGPPSPLSESRRPSADPRRTAVTGVRRTSGGGSDAPVLNSRYTFETFVTGSSNRLAHAGAKAVAQSPGRIYNPLFLYGPSGLGKTHLMHAIGNEITAEKGVDPRSVAYISGESFTSHFVTSLREQRTDEFRRKWRFVDLWLVDDIQFIAGKEHTKEEFFHTFNALYQTGKQIVISSDRSPRELRMMDERLRSRFECGLIADIAPPDLETRLAILHRKADSEGMRIPDEVLLYMAKLVQSNIRTLEGALVKLIAYASVVNSPVTTELASSILERYYIAAGIGVEGGGDPAAGGGNPGGAVAAALGQGFGGGGTCAVTAELVQRVVARRFGLPADALSGKKRDRDIVNARQIAMHLMRELTEMSLPGIGQSFGRDHSTVMHSCDKVRSQIPYDDDLRTLVEELTTQLRAQATG
ncbi:MAG: chromosomal replication initiator protein DnaA [Cytophagales bacterium]|nr:chromosomal replication initiator protein DnaA [Armatimonadota bacterium]